jgi:hypothetical protein
MISLVSIASNPDVHDLRQCLLIVGIVVWVLVMATAVQGYDSPDDSPDDASLPLAKARWPRWVVETVP